jgi:PAS domain S-box-containing protein
MKKAKMLRLAIAFIAFFILAFLVFKSRAVDFKKHQQYRDAIAEIQENDAIFNQNILKARYKFFTSYDSLVHNLAVQKKIQKQLQEIPNFIDARGTREIKSIVEKQGKLLSSKESLSEQFKSQNSALKNSLRYLPVLVTQHNWVEPLKTNLNNLLYDILLYNVTADEELTSAIKVQMEKLSQLKGQYAVGKDKVLIELALSHSKIILSYKPQVDQLTDQLLKIPLEQNTQVLGTLYSNYYQKALKTVNNYRLAAYGWFLIILAWITYLVIKTLYQANQTMLRYIQQVEKVTAAAAAVENDTFKPESLNEVAARRDELGQLARVFRQMVQTLKAREKELAEAKEQLEAVLDAVPGAISWIGSDGLYIGVNRYLSESLNLLPEAIIGKEVGFFSTSSELANFMRQFLGCSETAASGVIEVGINDSRRYYLVAAQKYQQGTATVSVGIDITERKQAEEALRIAEENYRSIFENALEGIFQSTPDGQYISVNPAMVRIYGYDSPDEMMAGVTEISRQLYVEPTCRDEFQRLMQTEGKVTNFEYQAYRKDGSIIWVEEGTRAVREASGDLLYYEGIIQDITQRKRQEEEMKRQLQELRIEIDHQKRQQEVAQITQSDYFQEIQVEAQNLQLDEFWS